MPKRGVLRSFLTAGNVTKQIELLMEHLCVLLQNLTLSAIPKGGSELEPCGDFPETIMEKDTLFIFEELGMVKIRKALHCWLAPI